MISTAFGMARVPFWSQRQHLGDTSGRLVTATPAFVQWLRDLVNEISLPDDVGWQAGDLTATLSDTVPTGWFLCDGRSLPVSSYSELFAAVGYAYGGGGTAFRLPNQSQISPLVSGNWIIKA